MANLKWFMRQQELRDRVLSKLAEMGILLQDDEDSEQFDTEAIIESVFENMLMVQQYFNGLIDKGDINDDYTPDMFYMDMLIIQTIRLVATRHGWDIEMEPIYEEDDDDE